MGSMGTDDIPEFPSLRPHDPVFSEAGQPSEVVTVQSGGLTRYALAYKVAADLLVQDGLAERSDLETLSGPICFLYRHFLELSLKALAERAGVPFIAVRRASHDLLKLWALVHSRLSDSSSAPQAEEDLAFTQLLSEWADWDRGSDAFRFPTDSKGDRFREEPVEVNLARVSEKMDQAYTYILGVGMSLYYQGRASE